MQSTAATQQLRTLVDAHESEPSTPLSFGDKSLAVIRDGEIHLVMLNLQRYLDALRLCVTQGIAKSFLRHTIKAQGNVFGKILGVRRYA